jgi:hypothetical protein
MSASETAETVTSLPAGEGDALGLGVAAVRWAGVAFPESRGVAQAARPASVTSDAANPTIRSDVWKGRAGASVGMGFSQRGDVGVLEV